MTVGKWNEAMQQEYISRMEANLEKLRCLAGLSQAELAAIIGVSRQSYSLVVSGRRPMSWRTYLALVFVFDSLEVTYELLHRWGIYPKEFIDALNREEER